MIILYLIFGIGIIAMAIAMIVQVYKYPPKDKIEIIGSGLIIFVEFVVGFYFFYNFLILLNDYLKLYF